MPEAKVAPYKSAADVPRGTPTPTQDELNKINLGETVTLAEDGSGADPNNQPAQGTVYGVKQTPPTAAHTSAHHEATTHAATRSSSRT
jgi:hypothetical protein